MTISAVNSIALLRLNVTAKLYIQNLKLDTHRALQEVEVGVPARLKAHHINTDHHHVL
jgi:hypothetical protein